MLETLQTLPTPCALVDLDVLEKNAARMAERADRLGVRLRPHVKTHRCVEAARIQIRGHFGGITVSTMAEAGHFAAAGFDDISYAVPIAPARLAAAAQLAATIGRFNLLLDHPATLSELEVCAEATKTPFRVWLKIDCGGNRAGVEPTGDDALSLAARLHRSPQVEFCGILTHAGHAYSCSSPAAVKKVAEQERDVMLKFAGRLSEAGIVVPEISIGSTPTIALASDLDGISEVRPGNYIFYDLFQAAIGVCAPSDIALSVLVTVIGSYPRRNQILIDAGALALSKDPGPLQVDPDCAFGAICSANGRTRHSALKLVSLSQEHGLISATGQLEAKRFSPGTKLRILPNHSCLTAAGFECYHVLRGGEVIDEWKPVRGW